MEVTTSTEFRKTFARLKEQTLVTVNGHPIGTWCPGTLPPVNRVQEAAPIGRDFLGPRATQAQRDELLRKINRSK